MLMHGLICTFSLKFAFLDANCKVSAFCLFFLEIGVDYEVSHYGLPEF